MAHSGSNQAKYCGMDLTLSFLALEEAALIQGPDLTANNGRFALAEAFPSGADVKRQRNTAFQANFTLGTSDKIF